MATRTYHGSCHCKAVRFEADLDLSRGTGKCNCTYCWKTRNWSMLIKPEAFRLVAGKDQLLDYTKGPEGHKMFCKTCGVRPYGYGHLPQLGGDYVGVQLSCLDDLDPGELIAAPLSYADGLGNNWWNPPSETRHL